MAVILVAALLACTARAGRHETRILVLGDSLTAGHGLAAADAFPSRLEAGLRALGHAVRVINGGVSGDTSAGGRARLDWALDDRPQIAIVELGANDGLRGLDPAMTVANLDAIIARLKAARPAPSRQLRKSRPNGKRYRARASPPRVTSAPQPVMNGFSVLNLSDRSSGPPARTTIRSWMDQ
ncbi:MAG: arylesterase [SAR324 cluster bacterium]|nr:arylesterase [SAR324 cluster bacterium]